MPLYTARVEGPRVYLNPVKQVTKDLKPAQSLKVLIITGDNFDNQQVDKLLALLGHEHGCLLYPKAYDLEEELKRGRWDKVVINMNTLTTKEEERLFYEIGIMKKYNTPTIIAYTEGRVTDSLQEAAAQRGTVDVIVAPFGGAYSTSSYPTKETLQAALEYKAPNSAEENAAAQEELFKRLEGYISSPLSKWDKEKLRYLTVWDPRLKALIKQSPFVYNQMEKIVGRKGIY